MCMMFSLFVYLSIMCVPDAHGAQKRMPDMLELECHMVAADQSRAL